MLVDKLHKKLLILDCEETRERTLMSVRILASHNADSVIDSLLTQHSLPFDDALVSFFWSIFNSKFDFTFVQQDLKLADAR